MEDLNAIVNFVRVVQANSFSAAARRQGISASQLSKQISRLEQELGTRLLQRTTRSLSLTEAGKVFLDHGLRIVEELESSREAVSRLQSEPSGRLRITALPSFAQAVLVPALPAFLARYPALAIELIAHERAVDLAEDGFDIALRVTDDPAPGVIARLLAPVHFSLYAAPDYLARRGCPQQPDDLKDHDLLGFPRSLVPLRWRFRSQPEQAPVLNFRFEMNSVEAVMALAIAGTGIAPLPGYAIGPALQSGELIEVLPGELDLGRHHIYAIYLPNRYGSPKIRAFLDFLQECIGDPPHWQRQIAPARNT